MGWPTDPADSELLIAAFQRCREAWNSSTIQSIKVGPEISPGMMVQTDTEISDWIRKNVVPTWHASSTCAMGKQGDRGAVVDEMARVFGTEGLRVVDLSVVLFSVPGHSTASLYMLAEEIADDIKNRR
jgi:choline dehydrogenase